MTNLALKQENIVSFPLHLVEKPQRRTTSKLKSNGVPKASAADPIRDVSDIKAMQEYYLSKNQIRNYCILTVGISFGIRAGDLINLKVADIQGDYLEVIEQKTRKKNRPYITKHIREVIDMYLSTRKDIQDNDYLFISRNKGKNGRPKGLTIQQLNNIIKDGAKACNVKGHISSHSLRKTFAYQLLTMNEYDEEARFTLQSMLNHNDMRTTMTYAGLVQEKQDDMRSQLDAVL